MAALWRVVGRLLAVLFHFLVKIIRMTLFKIRHHLVSSRTHCYNISISSSAVLLLVNVIVFLYGSQIVRWFMEPVQLQHGLVPVFPHHFFHGPDVRQVREPVTQSDIRNSTLLDAYLYSQVQHKSLSSPTTPVVHVVWCDAGPFTFTHYLSVLSAFKIFKPSVLYLHLISQPELDPDGYFQFLPDLKRDLPPLIATTLQYSLACRGTAQEKTVAFMHMLGQQGGVVVNGRTVLAPTPILNRNMNKSVQIAVQEDMPMEPLLLTAPADVFSYIPPSAEIDNFLKNHIVQYNECKSVRTFSLLHDHLCVFMHEDIHPVVIFNASSHFAHLARWIGYGTTSKLVSTAATSVIVPNIIHYVWLGKRQLEFFGYLSLLSSLYVLKAEFVYIHGDHKPMGDLWKEVELHPKIKFIHRDFPDSVFGAPIIEFASHASDYLRADILLRYGGVYSDWDVLFLKELPPSMRLHQTTASVDWPETGAFPDVFNLGVLVTAPGAPFLRHFLESYRWYLDRHWSYNAIHMPYKVYEKQPCSLNLDRHLQILCAHDKCHATWLHGYKEETADHLQVVDWRTDAVAIHWTHPDPHELTSRSNLLGSSTVTADIGKFILRQAGL